MIRVANAPCSWGVLEFDETKPTVSYAAVLDEMVATGYAGTELGPWGFLPTEPARLSDELARRNLALAGAFVPVALVEPSAIEPGIARAVEIARLLATAGLKPGATVPNKQPGATVPGPTRPGVTVPRTRVAGGDPPMLVLSDDNCRVGARAARAGRIEPVDGLAPADWDRFAAAAERLAREVRDQTGVRTAFHHHCGGFVETPAEVDALLTRTDPELVGLCLDTGHFTYGGGDPLDALARYGERIWHVHFKDCDPQVAARARRERWDYLRAVGAGLFSELGRGIVDFPAVVGALGAREYRGWIVVEQDVLAGDTAPAASARRNRQYLERLGL